MPITEHEPGGFRDRCDRCGGWISMGHAAGSACRLEMESAADPNAARKVLEQRKDKCHCAEPHLRPWWWCPVHGEVTVPMGLTVREA